MKEKTMIHYFFVVSMVVAMPDPSKYEPSISSADASLASSMTSLISNILTSLDNTPPPGQIFSQEDINHVKQAANLSSQGWDKLARETPYGIPTEFKDYKSDYDHEKMPPYRDPPLYNPYPPWVAPPPHKKDSNESLKVWLGVGIGVPLGIILLAAFGYLFWRYKQKRRALKPVLPLPLTKNDYTRHSNPNSSQSSPALPSDDPWELDRSRLSINYDKKLGSGAFCNVFKASIKGDAPVATVFPGVRTGELKNCDVAVKMLPSFADDIARSDFMQEINFMKSLAYHPHLVSMLGYVADRKNPMLLVEYCERGDLLHFIREQKQEIKKGLNGDGLKIKDLLSFSWQISNGCEYLNSVGCIHRDLAARNILVDSRNVCKIGDFGLCRLTDTLLYTARGGRLPLKWMAPESLSSYEYSFKSDVWSYGVLLWELFSLGEVPYSGIQTTDLLEFLERENRLDQPLLCPDEIFAVMRDCWEFSTANRPTFHRICARLAAMLEMATESYGYLVPNRRRTDSPDSETRVSNT